MTYDRIDYLETVFGGMTIGRYLNAILSQFMTKDKLVEITTFFEKRPIKQAERSIAQGLETIKTATELINRDSDAIKQFMTKDKLDEITTFFEKRPIKQAE